MSQPVLRKQQTQDSTPISVVEQTPIVFPQPEQAGPVQTPQYYLGDNPTNPSSGVYRY